MAWTDMHTMDVETFTDQQLVRFSCRSCDRCVESGPEGIRVLRKGDFSAAHQGGNVELSTEIDADRLPPPPVLH